jgi:hypothetical protein
MWDPVLSVADDPMIQLTLHPFVLVVFTMTTIDADSVVKVDEGAMKVHDGFASNSPLRVTVPVICIELDVQYVPGVKVNPPNSAGMCVHEVGDNEYKEL